MKRILVIFGKNWTAYPTEDSPKVHLSIESRLIAIAAAYLWRTGEYKQLLFTTGPTAGKNYPSEAAEMARYIVENYNIRKDAIALEEISIDTAENAEMVKKMVRNELVDFLSISFHVSRCQHFLEQYGVRAGTGIKAEEVIVLGNSPWKLKRFVYLYQKSKRYYFECGKEIILRLITKIDPWGRMLRRVTTVVRHRTA